MRMWKSRARSFDRHAHVVADVPRQRTPTEDSVSRAPQGVQAKLLARYAKVEHRQKGPDRQREADPALRGARLGVVHKQLARVPEAAALETRQVIFPPPPLLHLARDPTPLAEGGGAIHE